VGAFSNVNQEEGRVRFDPETGLVEEEPRANRLHRRDTPHHLKNKRIQSAGSDREQVAQILAQVLVQILHPMFVDTVTNRSFFTLIGSFHFFFIQLFDGDFLRKKHAFLVYNPDYLSWGLSHERRS
jgi:hypothetical protein